MALQNAVYAPDGAEQAVWTLSGQRKRPWFDHEHDPLRPPTSNLKQYYQSFI